MIWQDIIITIGSIVLLFGLFPTLRAKKTDKPPVKTSTIYTLVLTTFSITFFTLSLPVTATITLLTALAWATLAVQKYKK